MAAKKRKSYFFGKLMLVIYILFLFYFLLLSEAYGRTNELQGYRYNLELFKEIRRFWNYREQLGAFATIANLFGNVLVFVPFGFLFPTAGKYHSFLKTAFYSLGLSFIVEVLQLFFKLGCFDVDDLLLNTIGGVLGYWAFLGFDRMRKRYAKKTR
ncbi:MAG: VanZ family protein [Faecalimonas sp.]|nr:VanZ family protein [Faecalimonas sp.]